MEQRFKTSGQDIDLLPLREFIEREGEAVAYRRGDQMEREGDPTRWLAFVTEGCFKYITYGLSDERAHITWFSFEGEYVGDYPAFLYGRPAQTTIEAMMPSRVLRVTGEQLLHHVVILVGIGHRMVEFETQLGILHALLSLQESAFAYQFLVFPYLNNSQFFGKVSYFPSIFRNFALVFK